MFEGVFINGVAIFMEKDGVYEALNQRGAKYYLSDVSQRELEGGAASSSSMDAKPLPKVVVGRINSIEHHCASLSTHAPQIEKRLNLCKGTQYWTVDCTIFSCEDSAH